jgi:hypothetical protein
MLGGLWSWLPLGDVGYRVNHLSRLEQQLMIWLAIEREPVAVQVLRDDLVAPGSPRAVLEALRGLRQRSLVEQNAHGSALQNVVTEYLTDVLVDQICSKIAEGWEGGREGEGMTGREQDLGILSVDSPSPLHPIALRSGAPSPCLG